MSNLTYQCHTAGYNQYHDDCLKCLVIYYSKDNVSEFGPVLSPFLVFNICTWCTASGIELSNALICKCIIVFFYILICSFPIVWNRSLVVYVVQQQESLLIQDNLAPKFTGQIQILKCIYIYIYNLKILCLLGIPNSGKTVSWFVRFLFLILVIWIIPLFYFWNIKHITKYFNSAELKSACLLYIKIMQRTCCNTYFLFNIYKPSFSSCGGSSSGSILATASGLFCSLFWLSAALPNLANFPLSVLNASFMF